MYKAIPNSTQNFAVEEQDNGKYYCKKNQNIYDTFTYKWMLKLIVTNKTNKDESIILNVYNNIAEKLLDETAENANKLEIENKKEYDILMSSILKNTYNFDIIGKLNNYNGNTTIEYNVQHVNQQ